MAFDSEKLKPYVRKVNYYETDQMGIIHHANYIHYFEEARLEFMSEMGMPYDVLEKAGIIVPVLSVSAEYKQSLHFGDTVEINLWIESYNGVKMRIGYELTDQATGKLTTTGSSGHCFLSSDGRPITLKKANPEFHQLFMDGLKAYEEGIAGPVHTKKK